MLFSSSKRCQLNLKFVFLMVSVAISSTQAQESTNDVLLNCECGVVGVTSRIFGGRAVNSPSKFAWMAGIMSNMGKQAFCTGSLINNRFVLTAAHCLINRDESMVHIILGEADLSSPSSSSLYRPKRFYIHPSFTGLKSMQNDIALIELDRKVVFSEKVKPICLPKPGPRVFSPLTVAGWGLLSSGGRQPRVLQEAPVTQRSQAYCSSIYGTDKYNYNNHICAVGTASGVCNGDSGGPLMYSSSSKYFQVAIVSFGSSNCADTRYPAVFTRTSIYLQWIFSTSTSGQYCKG